MAQDVIDSEVMIVNRHTDFTDVFAVPQNWEMPERWQKKQGWARRQEAGEMYGPNGMTDEIKQIIADLFEAGEKDSSKKLNPNRMRDVLKQRFASRPYTLPTAAAIKAEISALTQKRKAKGDGAKSNKKATKEPPKAAEHKELLRNIVIEHGYIIMPKAAMELLLRRLGRRRKFSKADDDYLRGVVSTMKTQRNAKAKKQKKRALIG